MHEVRGADFKLLRRMQKLAVSFVTDRGDVLLVRDPLATMKPSKSDAPPRMEVADDDRYERTRKAIQELARRATSEPDRMCWRRLEFALFLVEGTGRRLTAVRRLTWDDIDLGKGTMTWRAKADKMRVKRVVNMPPDFMREVAQFARVLDASFGGNVCASPKDPAVPTGREAMHTQLLEAEAHAGPPKLDGTVWHGYRRRWATGVDGLPEPAATYAWGLKDPRTFHRYKAVTKNDFLPM